MGWTVDAAAPGHDFLKHDGKTVAGIHRVHAETSFDPIGLYRVFDGRRRRVHTVPKHGRIGSIFDPGGACLILRGPVPSAQT